VNEAKDQTLRLIVMWTLVAAPLGWGVYQTVMKAALLFK
jgi:hypothetical protein